MKDDCTDPRVLSALIENTQSLLVATDLRVEPELMERTHSLLQISNELFIQQAPEASEGDQ